MNQHQMIGSVGEFFEGYDDWDVYHERLEQFFEVNDVPEAKRSAFLISVIGADAYKSLRDLCHPVVPKDKPFEELCALLRKQFARQVAIYRERTKFYNAKHEEGENATQWYGRLKRLSVDCKFGSNLEQVLLDKFVTGLRPGQVLDRLCEEPETLKLEQALDIAINKECAAKDSAYLPVKRPPVNREMFPTCGGFQPQICPPRRPAPFSIDPPHSALAPQCAPYTVECAAPPLAAALKSAPNPVARFAMMDALEPEGGEGAQVEACAVAGEDGSLGGALGAAGGAEAAPAAGKAKRVRTRRRGRGGQGGANDEADKHSVDGEAKE